MGVMGAISPALAIPKDTTSATKAADIKAFTVVYILRPIKEARNTINNTPVHAPYAPRLLFITVLGNLKKVTGSEIPVKSNAI